MQKFTRPEIILSSILAILFLILLTIWLLAPSCPADQQWYLRPSLKFECGLIRSDSGPLEPL